MRKRSRASFANLALCVLVSTAWGAQAGAETPNEARAEARAGLASVERELPALELVAQSAGKAKTATAASRLAAAQRAMAAGDSERAIDWFSQVVELHRTGKANASDDAAALLLLGDAYIRTGQYRSAREPLLQLIQNSDGQAYRERAAEALNRLVDAGIRGNDTPSLEAAPTEARRLQGAGLPVSYAAGKALYALGRYPDALAQLQQVSATSPFAIQAGYLQGVVLTKEADEAVAASGATPNYAAAVTKFHNVARMPGRSPGDEAVKDLAWLAVGRLLYEMGDSPNALNAYSHVDAESPHYRDALQEVAWVYISLGDNAGAEKALTGLLQGADPEGQRLAEAALLQADLKLRSGSLPQAASIYETVRNHYEPYREEVALYLTQVSDPGSYYDLLVSGNATAQGAPQMPELALTWAREDAGSASVFTVTDDIVRSRRMVEDATRKAETLQKILQSPARVKAFPELVTALETSTVLLNRLARVRWALAGALDELEKGQLSDELRTVSNARRALMPQLSKLPVDEGALARRENGVLRRWNSLVRDLDWLKLQVDSLDVLAKRLQTAAQNPDGYGLEIEPEKVAELVAALRETRQDHAKFERTIDNFKNVVQVKRLQVGVGDEASVEDARLRGQFRELLGREVTLAAEGQGSAQLQAYAKSIMPTLRETDSADAKLTALYQEIDAQAATQAAVLAEVVAREAQRMAALANELGVVDQGARATVGGLARERIAAVGGQLKGIVMRADMGNAQQAWEARERARDQLIAMQRERARLEQRLNAELREVMEDAGNQR